MHSPSGVTYGEVGDAATGGGVAESAARSAALRKLGEEALGRGARIVDEEGRGEKAERRGPRMVGSAEGGGWKAWRWDSAAG